MFNGSEGSEKLSIECAEAFLIARKFPAEETQSVCNVSVFRFGVAFCDQNEIVAALTSTVLLLLA